MKSMDMGANVALHQDSTSMGLYFRLLGALGNKLDAYPFYDNYPYASYYNSLY